MPHSRTQSATSGQTTAGQTTAGFTLVEMVIVAGVMAILATISTPPIIQFIQQRDVRSEQVAQTEIRKALAGYIEERGAVPDDTITDTANANFWANQLAGYTNMSPAQMRLDQWDRPRAYSAFEATESVLGTPMPIFYATIISSGINNSAQAATGIPVGSAVGGIAPYKAPTDTGWWSRISGGQTARIAAFTGLTAAGDDLMIKLTDYPQKIEAYKTTLERLRRIGEALDSYSKSAYAERSTACLSTTCNPTAEQQIFYPPSGYSPELVADDATLYANTRGPNDVFTYNGSVVINNNMISNGSNNSFRRSNMIVLMRILGLPDEYCCSAVEVIPGSSDPITGKPQGMPFYYFSNPRARTNSTTCAATRPTATQRKLPARVTTQYINTGSSKPTCG